MARRDFKSFIELIEWLERSGIDLSTWGRGEAKRAADLWSEYASGESSFHDDPHLRLVEVVQVNIKRGDAILIEVGQELNDGRRRVRRRPPSEKVKRGEEPRSAALRCLREELGLMESEVSVAQTSARTEALLDSPSYPGLLTRYRFHTFEAAAEGLPDEDFYRENIPGDPVMRHLWGWRMPE